ncbi:MAG: hypothetical protein JEY71_18340 [Sphaerochaeta sp.]|nr:hypothetical protein [Sphaerochaeta sp.]
MKNGSMTGCSKIKKRENLSTNFTNYTKKKEELATDNTEKHRKEEDAEDP